MQLLCELLAIQERLKETLNEDLSAIKKAGLGRMINAFKQSYYFRSGDKKTGNYGPHTSDSGKTIHARMSGVGKGSEIVNVEQPVTGWNYVKKVYRMNRNDKTDKANPVAVVFYVAGKSVALVITGEDSFDSPKNIVGVSWDFSGTGNEDDVQNIIDGLGLAKSKDESEEDGAVVEKQPIRHYQGVGVAIRDVGSFVDRMSKVFGAELTMKLILADTAK